MEHNRKISVVGLGYVGLTIAAAFSQIGKVIAYDKNSVRISELKKGYDRNEEVSAKEMNLQNIHFTTNTDDLKEADFHIIAVPTPLDVNRQPCFTMLKKVSENIGKGLKKGDIVVYESSVYPGATEEICIPVLEQVSNLVYGKDFTVGYSPERINPSDKEHNFFNITKIISATDEKTLDILSKVYKSVIRADIHRVSSMKIAEATKVIENTQRDVNIAFMNDIAIMLHTLGIDTAEVIAAMKTKWNFIPFQPGLVGGHCIGVNSYYLMYKAEEEGYHSNMISFSRQINESIAKFIVDETIKKLIHLDIPVKKARIAILGFTYKENCSDLRDTGVIKIIKELQSYGSKIFVHDPIAEPASAKKEYGITLNHWEEITNLDAIILTVAHKQYINLDRTIIKKMLNNRGLIMDVKELFDSNEFSDTDIVLWRL